MDLPLPSYVNKVKHKSTQSLQWQEARESTWYKGTWNHTSKGAKDFKRADST